MNTKQSQRLYEKARTLMPGGVSSPVRSFNSVGGGPLYMERGKGSTLWDVDGNAYLDFCLSWGPLILGHARDEVLETVREVAANGLTFGTPSPWEITLAEKITGAVKSVDEVRFVCSGTEALMSALRLARGATGRSKVLKFDGGYHGHGDSFLVKAGSGLKTFGHPSSPGVTHGTAQDSLVAKFNDIEGFLKLLEEHGKDLAAVVVEPLPGNSGMIPLEGEFLNCLRSETRKVGALLILDEVITGFRLGYGSYGESLGVQADLLTFGKIIGGGMPVGAYGGRRDLMEKMAPQGPIYQAGTLAGNPVAMAAGAKTLEILEKENPYRRLQESTARLAKGISDLCEQKAVPVTLHQRGSLLWPYFGISTHPWGGGSEDEKAVQRFVKLHGLLLEEGVYLPPSAWELWFWSTAHSEENLDGFLKSFRKALDGLS